MKYLPWGLFFFLFIIFIASSYDLFYTIRDTSSAYEIEIAYVEKGNIWRKIALIALGSWGLFNLIFKMQKRDMKFDFLASLLLFYIIWTALSISWSDNKILTLRSVVAMFMLWFGAAWIAIRYSIRDITYFAFFSGCTTIILGIIIETYLGTFHPLDIYYRFAGTIDPNAQGLNCSILAIASYSLSKTENRWKFVFIIFTIIAFMLLFLTKSRSSFLGAFFAITTYWALTSSWNRKTVSLTITIWVSCIVVLLFGDQFFDFIYRATYIGRPVSDLETLSLRLPLWQKCIRFLSQQPIQGFGYGSFWTEQRINIFSRDQGWGVFHSHSGYIELALGLGIIGLLTYISILFIGTKRAFLAYFKTRNCKYVFCISFFMFWLLKMFFERVNMNPTIPNFLCIIMIFKMSLLNLKKL